MKRMMAIGRIRPGAATEIITCATVRRECAWCGKHIGDEEWPDAEPGSVTHGICKPCADKFRRGGK